MVKKVKFNLQDSLIYVGLDCETSSDRFDTAKPIQIGATIYKNGELKTFGSFIRHDFEDDWSSEAYKIHKIDPLTLKKAPEAKYVDLELLEWLNVNLDYPDDESLIAVGWNVNSFDFHFLKPAFKKSLSLFSRRVVELNSLIFYLSGTQASNFQGFDQIKDSAKNVSRDIMKTHKIVGNDHDAVYDSALGLVVFSQLREFLR